MWVELTKGASNNNATQWVNLDNVDRVVQDGLYTKFQFSSGLILVVDTKHIAGRVAEAYVGVQRDKKPCGG